ncbi:hypothetical protein [Campylobacter majalis]
MLYMLVIIAFILFIWVVDILYFSTSQKTKRDNAKLKRLKDSFSPL